MPTATSEPSPTPEPSATPTPDIVTVGAPLYATHCSICHGASGEGGGNGLFPALADAANLSQPAVVTLITNGRAAMPGFAAAMTAAEIEAVALYARTQF